MTKNKTYRFTWGEDFNTNLYERTITISTCLIGSNLTINCEGKYYEVEYDYDNIYYYINKFIDDNLSWITESDDKYIIGENNMCPGDMVFIDLLN